MKGKRCEGRLTCTQLKVSCRLDVRRQAASSLEAAEISCRHLKEALQLAVEQRFTHEYDDTEAEKHWYGRRAALGTRCRFTAKLNEFPEMETAGKSFVPSRGRNGVNCRTSDQNSAESCIQGRRQPAVSVVNPGSARTAGRRENMIPSNELPPVTNLHGQTLRR